MRYLFCFYALCFSSLVEAQSDRDLVVEYFRLGDCEKALVYSDKLLKEQFSRDILIKHIDCLIKEKKWEDAETFLKRQIKKDLSNQPFYYFQWARVCQANGNTEEAQRHFENVAFLVSSRVDLASQFIEEFRKVSESSYAKKIALAVRNQQKNANLYRLELAGIYQELGETENMITELLAYGTLVRNSEVVKNMLQDFLKTEEEGELLEKVLYDNIQKSPNEVFYSELLVWHQVQKKDFYKAFLQERSLDKRLKTNGTRIVELSRLALQNEDYTNTLRMYAYLMKEYPQSELYPYARRMSIYVREIQVKQTYPVDLSEVKKLISDYEELLSEVGGNINALEALRNMAMLHALYLGDRKSAIELLSKAIQMAAQEPQFSDRCKLDLGDIYVLESEPWEASLIYSQVEKSQKDNVLGYEAKLRNAKLYYFKGEFELARSVLNVLKKATSREIANDASALSLLILDNTGLDSSEDAMRAYSSIELLLFQHKYEESLDSLGRLYARLKDHSLADEILWLQASTFLKLGRNDEAERCLLQIIKEFHYDILADNAVYQLATLYETKLRRKEDAMKYYQMLMEKYPASVFVADARKRYRQLRGDVVN
jgi:tetratricopeptide (TPR) repeat protein